MTAINEYISLDGKKYATLAKSWQPYTLKPNTVRFTLGGDLDITYSAATPVSWEGEIVADVTARGTGWGTIENLRTTLVKKTSVVLIDHYGNSYNVHPTADIIEKSVLPNWNDPSNSFHVNVVLVKESVVT